MIPRSSVQNLNSPNKTAQTGSNPGILNLFACKCPRCRTGNMFMNKNPWHLKSTMKMNKICPVCSQPLDLEPGFYFGSSYVSYAFTVALSAAIFVACWLFSGFPLSEENNRIYYWLGFNAFFLVAIQPYLMRVSRTGWLAFFVKYDENWRTNPPEPLERTNKTHENNW